MANYTSKETIELLSINRNFLDVLRNNNIIKSDKFGRSYYYTDKDIEEFLDTYLGKSITKGGLIFNEG